MSVCEWYPDEGRAATSHDPVHGKAEVVVGARGQWHLCRSCAALPEFRRFRVRKPVHKAVAPEVERIVESRRRRGHRR